MKIRNKIALIPTWIKHNETIRFKEFVLNESNFDLLMKKYGGHMREWAEQLNDRNHKTMHRDWCIAIDNYFKKIREQ